MNPQMNEWTSAFRALSRAANIFPSYLSHEQHKPQPNELLMFFRCLRLLEASFPPRIPSLTIYCHWFSLYSILCSAWLLGHLELEGRMIPVGRWRNRAIYSSRGLMQVPLRILPLLMLPASKKADPALSIEAYRVKGTVCPQPS